MLLFPQLLLPQGAQSSWDPEEIRKDRSLVKVKSVLLSIALFCVSLMAEESKLLPAGSAAPTFSLPSLDGDRVSLRVFCGDTLLKPHINNVRHIVVLSFWATYCIPCQKEIPELIKFAEKHRNDSIKVFCVSIDKEGASIVSPFVKEKGYDIPVLLDPYQKTAERYGVKSLPALFVIDQFGKICYAASGYNESESLDEKLEQIISDIRKGHNVEAAVAGESVAVQNVVKEKKIPAKARWDAVVKVECGVPVNNVAENLGVTPEEIRSWYADLKNAAISLWPENSVK